MKKATVTTIMGIFLLAAHGGAQAKKSYWELHEVEPGGKVNVAFHIPGMPFERIRAKRNRHNEGWVEEGAWQASAEHEIAQVRVYMATLYGRRAFNKKHKREMRELASIYSGNRDVEHGRQGVVKTNSGPIEYLFYRRGSAACVVAQKYWSDPDIQGDVTQLHGTLEWVAGSNFVYAAYCRRSREPLQLADLGRVLHGITARNVYWPANIFESVDGSYVNRSGPRDSQRFVFEPARIETAPENAGVDASNETANDAATSEVDSAAAAAVAAATPAPTTHSPPRFDLAGVYEARVKRRHSDDYWCFNQRRRFDFELEQDGNRLNGRFLSSFGGKITGTLIDDRVEFDYYTTKCAGGMQGEWKVGADGASLDGHGWSEIEWRVKRKN